MKSSALLVRFDASDGDIAEALANCACPNKETLLAVLRSSAQFWSCVAVVNDAVTPSSTGNKVTVPVTKLKALLTVDRDVAAKWSVVSVRRLQEAVKVGRQLKRARQTIVVLNPILMHQSPDFSN